MKRRHPMQNGGMNNTNRSNRPQGRYNNNGGGGFQGNNRPRKNFPALREKYLNMAKDAMGSGDRVLAEYYLQHADHYYRMQAEFMAERQTRFQNQPQANGAPNNEMQPEEMSDEAGGMEEEDVNAIANSNALPSFITQGGRPQAQQQNDGNQDKMLVNANWEEE